MRNHSVLLLTLLAVALLVHGGTSLHMPQLGASGLSSIIHFDSVADAFKLNPLVSTLHKALEVTDLLGSLNETGVIATVVAPTNSAFKSLLKHLEMTEEELFDQKNRPLLTRVLKYHVVPDLALKVDDLHDGEVEETLLPGQFLTFLKETYLYFLTKVTVKASDPKQRSATVLLPDIEAAKVIIHVINRVLLPEDEDS